VSGQEGRAHSFLGSHPTHKLHITFTIAGELASGLSMGDRARWERFVAPFEVLGCTPDTSWEYGRVFRYLKENGLQIGSNDLWIAASALAFEMCLVTRNEQHFRRVPGLEVVGYGA